MIRKFLSVFSVTPNKSKLLSHSTLWSGPCLAYLWSCCSGFSCDLFASATSWLFAFPPPDEALVRSGLTHAIHWTGTLLQELHVVQVKSVLRCLLREVFLSSIPLAFFIFFMALLISGIALFFCSLFAPMERKLYEDLDCWVSCFIVPRTCANTWNDLTNTSKIWLLVTEGSLFSRFFRLSLTSNYLISHGICSSLIKYCASWKLFWIVYSHVHLLRQCI